MGQDVDSEVAPLELAFAQVAPLSKGDRRSLAVFHGQSIAMHEVERKHMAGGAVQVGRVIEVQVLGEDVDQVGTAFSDVVWQQFDAVDAHQCQQREVLPLEFGPGVLEFHCGKLAPKHFHEEIAAAAGRLQEARVDPLGLVLHEVEHGLNHPFGGKDFPMVGNALFGLD